MGDAERSLVPGEDYLQHSSIRLVLCLRFELTHMLLPSRDPSLLPIRASPVASQFHFATGHFCASLRSVLRDCPTLQSVEVLVHLQEAGKEQPTDISRICHTSTLRWEESRVLPSATVLVFEELK